MSDIENYIGNTPLVLIDEVGTNQIYGKLEGNNPAGSIKDRPAIRMIKDAESSGFIKKGDTLIEATSGNTGIALAMAASIRGFKIKLIMPETASIERIKTMKAYGAEVILVTKEQDMEGARDLAIEMSKNGEGHILNQFSNKSNYLAHYDTTGPEIWSQTDEKITHFISAMGTTGTITGVSRFLKEKNNKIKIIGVQPTEGSRIPGIRRWKPEYVPEIFQQAIVDQIVDISQQDAELSMEHLSQRNGLFVGVSAGANVYIAKKIASELENSIIVTILCDRGDRYLSKI
ncbi:MAG: cysteine synthase CysM [Pseudomonadota bacterium]|nr:cysteine synthase CysM [Pseudomonadota bacterium]